MALVFIKTQTASSDTSIDFINGTSDVVLDGTYNEYVFFVTNYKPVTDEKMLCFQVDTGTATTYGQTITSAAFKGGHSESGGWSVMSNGGGDKGQATGTGLQSLTYSGESNTYAEMSSSGTLTLYAPSDGTYIKHFQSRFNTQYTGNNTDAQTYTIDQQVGGYFHTTTALTRVRFAALSGSILTGTFALYGVS